MPAILTTIINGFTSLLSFFRVFSPWIASLTTFMSGFLTYRAARVVFMLSAFATASAVLYTFVAFLVSAFNTFLSLLTRVFTELNNTQGVASCLLYWLNAFGLVDGLVLATPFLSSTLAVILSFLIWRYAVSLVSKLYSFVAGVFWCYRLF